MHCIVPRYFILQCHVEHCYMFRPLMSSKHVAAFNMILKYKISGKNTVHFLGLGLVSWVGILTPQKRTVSHHHLDTVATSIAL
jgi:hypothetical protein